MKASRPGTELKVHKYFNLIKKVGKPTFFFEESMLTSGYPSHLSKNLFLTLYRHSAFLDRN